MRKIFGVCHTDSGPLIVYGFRRNEFGEYVVVHRLSSAKKTRSSILRQTSRGEEFFMAEKKRVYLADCVRG